MITLIKSKRGVTANGFTLIEVMVALLILSGGLLGVAYLQTWSLQFGQESFNRSQVLALGNQMIDRMYANQISALDPNDREEDYLDPVDLGSDTPCDPMIVTIRNDVVCFATDLAETLPAGNFEIETVDADNIAGAESFRLTVFWSDKGLTRQADRSREDIADFSLDDQASCNSEDNRIWSDDLSWPQIAGHTPTTPTCLVSYSWMIQVVDPNELGVNLQAAN
ncbi:MAG: type IV pilus modification protein PilV [Pseudomonadota bacterium]